MLNTPDDELLSLLIRCLTQAPLRGNRQAVDRLEEGSEIPDQFGMETKWKHFDQNQAPEEKAALQAIEKTGATRRSRTGDTDYEKHWPSSSVS